MGNNFHCEHDPSNDKEVHYLNKLIMRSRVEHDSTTVDLPSLVSFTGESLNFHNIGPVTLESSDYDDY